MKKVIITVIMQLLLFSSIAMGTIINVPNPYETIQEGIDNAADSDTVLVDTGTYPENIIVDTKNITLASKFLTTQDTSYISSTIINGGADSSIVAITNCPDTTMKISGFTITNGNSVNGYGGGIYIYNSNPQLTYLYVKDNQSTFDGGGIICINSDPYLYKMLVINNETEWNGGGICAYYNSNVEMNNVTFSQNIAQQNGSSIACLYNSNITINNSIIWNTLVLNRMYTSASGNISATYSDIINGNGQSYFGEGCINSNPLFDNYYHITWTNVPTPDTTKSPCIDTGDPNSPSDPDGTRRDMGAFYFIQTGIKGKVTLNGGTGDVENVEIIATYHTTGDTAMVTNPDTDGYYRLNVTSDTYDIEAKLSGYVTETYDDIVVANELVTLNITLSPPQPGRIIGKVSVNEGLGNVLEANITAGDITVHPYKVMDSLSGMFLYYEYSIEIPAGNYDVIGTLTGYYDSTIVDVNVEPFQATTGQDFEFQLIKFKGYVEGNVSLKGGSGDVQNVVVTADTLSTNPDINGDYMLNLYSGYYDIAASLDGYTSVTIDSVTVTYADTTKDIDMILLPWEVMSGTQYSETAFLTSTYDGDFVLGSNPNNQLAAFGPNDSCRGVAEWRTGNHPFWCTDLHYWSLDGYWFITLVSNDHTGTEQISFKLYNSDTDSIYDCSEIALFYDDQDSVVVIADDLTITSPLDTMEFSLINDWNWISFNLTTSNNSVDSVFDQLTPNDIHQVKNQTQSSTYYLGGWSGDLNYIYSYDGFLVFMNNAYDPFEFIGEPINTVINPILLNENWNWISYYPDQTYALSDALKSIGSNGICIKSQTKSAIYDGAWIGDLTVMEKGKSYKICMEESKALTYPPKNFTPTEKNIKTELPNIAGWKLMSGTKNNMIALARIYLNDVILEDNGNYAVGVFDNQDNCHSIGKKINDFWYFTVVGNDNNQELSFKVYQLENDKEYYCNENINFQEDVILGSTLEPIQITCDAENNNALEFKLFDCEPNPFHNSTRINFQIPKETEVTISVYNILGQKVKTLLDNEYVTGKNFVVWNGTDDNNNELASGIYFYKITTGTTSKVKKLIKLN